jgi:hypothetical protein
VSNGVVDVRLPKGGVWRIGPGHDPFEIRALLTPAELNSPTSGNRFDSPAGNYGVLYFGTTPEVCFGETLARFRPDPNLASVVEEWSHLGFMPPGEIAADWRAKRLLVRATIPDGARFLDIESAKTRTALFREIGPYFGALGVSELDVAAVRGPDRRVTRLVSYWAWSQVDAGGTPRYAGVRYLSRLESNWECWAVFDRVPITELARGTIRETNPDLRRVAKLFDLRVF